MLIFTAETIIAAAPCADYPPGRVRELVGDGGLDASKLLRLRIPPEDRWWALVSTGVLPDDLLRYIASGVARSALARERRAGRDPDPRSWEAVKKAREFSLGRASREGLRAAWSAAESAAWSAAESAAESAAWSAAYGRFLRIALRAIQKWEREGRLVTVPTGTQLENRLEREKRWRQ